MGDGRWRSELKAFFRQLLIVFVICTAFCIIGCINGWISVALPRLENGTDRIKVTSEEGSMLAVYPEFGHFIAPIPTGILSDAIGRKPIFFMASLLSIIGWLITRFAARVSHLLLGRLILGFTFGMVTAVSNIYLSEISSKNYRNRFNNLAFLFNGVGVLIQFFAGGYVSIWFSSSVAVSLSVLFFVQCFFIVESPYVLLARGKENKAMLNLKWLRASKKRHLNEEFASIVTRVHTSKGVCHSLRVLLSRRNRKGFFLIISLSFLGDMTGRAAVLTYAKENFVADGNMNTHDFSVLLGICIVIMSIIPTILADRIGARGLIFKTAILGGVLQFFGGALFYIRSQTSISVPYYGWLLFIATGGYLCCAYIFSSNIMSLRGELIPENSRGLASGITSMTYALSIFTSIKLYQIIRDSFDVYCSFWFLATCSFIFAIFTSVFIPDTKNKTLQQIQDELEMKYEPFNESSSD